MTIRMTPQQATEQGYTIDRHCNPPIAYKGPRFNPTEVAEVIPADNQFIRYVYDFPGAGPRLAFGFHRDGVICSGPDNLAWRCSLNDPRVLSWEPVHALDPARVHLHPCHVTGEHQPNHHLDPARPDFICRFQHLDILNQILEQLGLTLDDFARADHEDCYWCETGDGWPADAPEETIDPG